MKEVIHKVFGTEIYISSGKRFPKVSRQPADGRGFPQGYTWFPLTIRLASAV